MLQAHRSGVAQPAPATAGIGLRDRHVDEIVRTRPSLGWLEVHSENWFGDEPHRHAQLQSLRADYPLSLHGVGLSLGSVEAPDPAHLYALRRLVNRYEPWLVSEHACWGAAGGLHSNNLLPLPRTHEALAVLSDHIGRVQDALGRTIAIENVSAYLQFEPAEFDEAEFLAELVQRSGCQLLLDISNLHINAFNHGYSAHDFLARLPAEAIAEYHLGGFEDRGHTLIDTHDRAISEAAWALYAEALSRIGPRPTLIEWDSELPALDVLVAQMQRANTIAGAQA